MQKIFENKEEFIAQYHETCESLTGRSFEKSGDLDRFQGLAYLIAAKARNIQVANEREIAGTGKKRVYYFSLEFLIGPLLDNYLINLGIRDFVDECLHDMGSSLDALLAQEVDPGLGNGGLGRLAACFLDSMAHEGIVGYGNGMRYRYGFFRQEIVNGAQVETTDNWLEHGYPWEIRKSDRAVNVRFGGEVIRHEDEDGKYWFTWEGGQEVRAVPYDVPIVGYGGEHVNHLRLWSAEPVEEHFNLDAFNAGNYAEAMKFRTDIEAISTILYPNDSGEHGRLLRLKQEYLLVAAGLQTILSSYKKEYGEDAWDQFPDRVAIHTNDTHPAMCGPELMRLLVDEEGLDFDRAFDIMCKSISYTNHTVLPEALETWPIQLFRSLLPRTYMFIDEINHRFLDAYPKDHDGWQNELRHAAILWDGQVRMANLSVVCSHSVNGVSELHTSIIERTILHEFYKLTPEKFNNRTNGIAHRRFLAEANPSLAALITEAIGDGWMDDADQLARLKDYTNDASFLERFAASKRTNKERLAAYIQRETGVVLDPDSIFDAQVKRFHAYKRQHLNVLKVLDLYNRIISDPTFTPHPVSFIFSGKAAQSYHFAKEVIRLINAVADMVNADERVNRYMKVAFVPNFAVSNAQLIYPAAEISEQISTAGKEASGTSNMKLMMNGAITLGTLDGSNVEISRLAGTGNIKIFGLTTQEVEQIRNSREYWAQSLVYSDPDRLGRVVEMLRDGTLSTSAGNFEVVYDNLISSNDQDFVLHDFHAYVQAFDQLVAAYADAQKWNRAALANVAASGFFSSDRTIREYAHEIWHLD